MRKALIVGTDFYHTISNLNSLKIDTESILDSSETEANNCDVLLETSTGERKYLTKIDLRNEIELLFKDSIDFAFFYFSENGYIDSTNGYLTSSEYENKEIELTKNDLLKIINSSNASNKIIIFDSCHPEILKKLSSAESKIRLIEQIILPESEIDDQFEIYKLESSSLKNHLVDALISIF